MTPAILKGPNRRTRQKAAEALYREARLECRQVVMTRDQHRCRVCCVYLGDQGHVHEVRFRSLGGAAVVLFSWDGSAIISGDAVDPDACVYLCGTDHAAVHAHKMSLSLQDGELHVSRPDRLVREQ